MGDRQQPHQPGPDSGYREQQDPRGQPGEDKTSDGKRPPREIEEDPGRPEPGK